MSEVKLAATTRTEFGKGAARRIRRADQIPAVLYGHGSDPLHITIPGHATMLALKHANALFAIDLEGTNHLAVAKDVQRDPVKNVIEHVDLLIVKSGEKITVEVPVHVVGEPADGAVAMADTQTIQLEAEATHLPEGVEVSVEGLEAGAIIRGADLQLPEGSVLMGDPDSVVVTVTTPATGEDAAADEETGEAAASGESAAEGAEA